MAELSEVDFRSETWNRACADWRRRLEELREQNDVELDLAETAALRGRIAEVKFNLARADAYRKRLAARGNAIQLGDVSLND